MKAVVLTILSLFLSVEAAQGIVVDPEISGVREDLRQLEKLELSESTPLHQSFFGKSLQGKNHLKWLSSRATRISLDPDFCVGGLAAACVDEALFPGRIFVSHPEFDAAPIFNSPYSFAYESMVQSHWITRVALLIHEAKHLNALIRANEPFSMGVLHEKCESHQASICDTSTDSAYGFQAVFLYNVAQYCVNGCTEEDRKNARAAADALRPMLDQKTWNLIQIDLVE